MLATERLLRAALVKCLREAGVEPELVDAEGVDVLTEDLRASAVLVAVDDDPAQLSEAAARAGVDRVLLVVSRGGDTASLVGSDRAWTVLELASDPALEDEDPQGGRPLDHEGIAEAVVTLLRRRDAVGRAWRLNPDGVPVAAT